MQKKMIVFLVILVLSLAVSGCSDKEESITIHGDDGEKIDINYAEGSENEACPIGTTVKMTDPNTGETMTMEVVGTEVIEGIEMCHTVAEINVASDDDIARMEMYTPVDENDESFIMTYYDKDNNVMSETKIINGKMTMTDDEGNVVMEMDIPEDE
ncbi:hypothetical protein [Methanolobus sp. ZRKC5]|uniref:hypothetical protein n=1 Tax=unclassified Methanolobus TaxID=2629569 RepID=UPI00313DAC9A